MNKKLVWFRWIFLFPGAIIAGILATFPLHWVLYFLLNGGETELGSLKFFAQLISFGASYKEVEYLLSPFIIALVYIIVGARIAPNHKLKTAIILFTVYAISWLVVSVVLLTGNIPNMQFSFRTILALSGAVLGMLEVAIMQKKGVSLL